MHVVEATFWHMHAASFIPRSPESVHHPSVFYPSLTAAFCVIQLAGLCSSARSLLQNRSLILGRLPVSCWGAESLDLEAQLLQAKC